MKQTYIALRDCLDLQGRFWFSGFTRKLTEEQAARYLKEEKATHYTPPPPRRYVEITDVRAGTTERITWSEYLKRRYKARTKKTA